MTDLDDLDDLLAELDVSGNPSPIRARTTRVSIPETPSPPKNARSDGAGSPLSPISPEENSIDDLLNDLESTSPGAVHARNAATRDAFASPESSGGGGEGTGVGVKTSGKCFPVYLGGTDCDLGMSPGRACDALRCTKCDFDVIRVKDMRWTDECDYLFFRNFYPNLEKLKTNLRADKGTCSYACQCTWRSAKDLDSVGSDIRWICGGHGGGK